MTPHAEIKEIARGQRPLATALKASQRAFTGFLPPTSNTTYTPNQFFDVCLPHASRGTLRLVAYMIRKTLGWCDANGNPQESQIRVSYQALVDHAGISREMIRSALNEAIAGHFIRCLQTGRAKTAGDGGQTALYELCWDASSEYVKDPKRFRGFFEGEGNRTDIPNEFFDRLIPSESLAVIKVVGSIIRFSIGFQARRGRRRQQAQLSYRHIQRYARIQSRTTLAAALRTALRKNYALRLEEGFFDLGAAGLSRAATYGLKWADAYSPSLLRENNGSASGSASPDDQSEIRPRNRSENRTVIGQKSVHEDRSEKRPDTKMKQGNETLKQQAKSVDADYQESYKLLREQGFDVKNAKHIADNFPKELIRNQCRWLPLRRPERNPAGMLRMAIEGDWLEPRPELASGDSPGVLFASHFYAAYAGNPGQPVAEPSTRDVRLADAYIQRILGIDPTGISPAEWGRAFGKLVREDFPSPPVAGVSIAWALRVCGDGFYLRHQARRKAAFVKARIAAREAHEARYRPAWLQYLSAEEKRVKNEKPEALAAFRKDREARRKRDTDSPWQLGSEAFAASFDSKESRLIAFRTFFGGEVLGFWEWDTRWNPHRWDDNQITP